MLRCPVCKKELLKLEKAYVCKNKHTFDTAKQGYTNLLMNQSSKIKGDSKEMLKARSEIQDKGYYSKLMNGIIKLLQPLNIFNVLDIGCGSGYYTSSMAYILGKEVIGIDIAKDALKIASRKDKNASYFVASNNLLPIQDNSIDVVTNIFSPIYLDELLRVLKKDGYILVVSPNKNHLIEMKQIIYNGIIEKSETRNNLSSETLNLTQDKNVTYTVELEETDIKKLFLMTPHYWTSTIEGKDRLNMVKTLKITFDFNLKLYKKK